MRRSRCSALLLAGALAGAARPAAGQQAFGEVDFLLLPNGARATALGQAAAADGGTTEALFWNPAGLAHLTASELALHHYDIFIGSGDAVTFALGSPSLGTFAIAAYLVDYGDFDVTPIGGGTIGRATSRNVGLFAAYASEVAGGVAAGITYKLAQFRVDCGGDCTSVPTVVGTTHAVDVGVQVTLPAFAPIVVGAALRNVGFKLQLNNRAQADPLPTRLQMGVMWAVVRAEAGREALDVRVLADVQGAVGRGALDPVTLVGVESGVGTVVRLRAGYAFLESAARGPSLGIGLSAGKVVLDLARVFYAEDALAEKEPLHVSLRWTF